MATISLLNTSADLSGKTAVTAEGDRTITGLLTYSRSASAPFAVNVGAAKVANLNADQVDGLEGASFFQTTGGTLLGDLLFTDALYDVGKSGATRPRDGFFSRNVSIGGTLTLASTLKATNALVAGFCQGRLTLTTAVPVTTADVTGATTIYFTPQGGNLLGLFDGASTWTLYPFTEISLGLGTLTSGLPYDVFVYDNAGTPTLEFLAWTNGTTRATALTTQNGVLVKTGATTRRYLGTFYTTSTTQTEDSAVKRFLWNFYNRVPKSMYRTEATASWTYTTATLRQANAATANQLAFVIGVASDSVDAYVNAICDNSNANVRRTVSIGLNVTNATSTGCVNGHMAQATAGEYLTTTAQYFGTPAAGYNFLAWLEYSAATGTTTWYNVVGPGVSGITGKFFC